ncbi:hypothetical protein SESBI_48834 [Sesbania bispinosa]|nr:hypothetical protein SESBI_48834 [Sesbania bispinosa]
MPSNKGQPQIQNTQNPLIGSPPASHIQPIQNLQKVMGLAGQVISGEQPDWNAVTKEIPFLQIFFTHTTLFQEVTDFARALTMVKEERVMRMDAPTLLNHYSPQSEGGTDGVIPTQTSGTDS